MIRTPTEHYHSQILTTRLKLLTGWPGDGGGQASSWWSKMLSKNKISQFQEEGYLLLESFFQGHKLSRYLSVLEEVVGRARSMNQNHDQFRLEYDDAGEPIPGKLHKVQGVCVVEPKALEIASDGPLLDCIESFVGPDIDVFGTKLFPKFPRGGTSSNWHQDRYYWEDPSEKVISCAIYYEDTDRDNGCLRVVPRSHLSRTVFEHRWGDHKYSQQTEVDESQAVDVPCPAGSVVLFSGDLLHGTYHNYSERTRYSTAWHYLPSDLQFAPFARGEFEDRFIVRSSGTKN